MESIENFFDHAPNWLLALLVLPGATLIWFGVVLFADVIRPVLP